MKVKDVNGNEQNVSVQTGRGYSSHCNNDGGNIAGFRYGEEIYILSPNLKLSYIVDEVYDTVTKVKYDRKTLFSESGIRKKFNSWRSEDVSIDTVLSIVADKLLCEVEDIDIVMVNVHASRKLSASHAPWKIRGHMPVVSTSNTRIKWDNSIYTIDYTGTWPMPKHLLDRCTITETKNTITESKENEMKIFKVEMI
jgi:hypothetical protein